MQAPPQRKPFNWTLILSGLTLCVLVVQAFIFYSQYGTLKEQARILRGQQSAMEKQLREMKSGGISQQGIACAAQISAQAARDSATAMKESVTQAKTALKATTDQSRKALEATMEAGRTEQRAYICFFNLDGPGQIKGGEEFSAVVTWLNAGKTPAQGVKTAGYFWVQLPGKPQKPSQIVLSGVSSTSELGSGIRMQSTPRQTYDGAISSTIMSGNVLLCVGATADYDDIFGFRWRAEAIAQFEYTTREWVIVSITRSPYQRPHKG